MQPASKAIALGVAMFLSADALGQINAVELYRIGVFNQTSEAAPTNGFSWTLVGRVLTWYSDDLFSCDILCPTIGLNEPLTQYGGQWLWYSPNYTSKAALDAALPPNLTYAFDLFGPAAIGQTSLSSPTPLFASAPPHFSGNTYTTLQGVNPNADIPIHVDGFEEVPGANDSTIFLDIYDLTHGGFVYADNGPAASTTFVVPALTLLPDTDYVVRAIYSSRLVRANAAFGTASTSLAFDLNTELLFRTRTCVADLDGVPGVDLNDFFAFFSCWDLSLPCADLDGSPGIDLGDFFAFFNGFDEGC